MYKHLRCLLVSLLTVETPIVPAMALELDVNALEQALKDNPNDAASSILLARHYLSQNKLEQADGILARLPVTDATVARLRQQIAATQKHSALLRSLDVDNPFLTTSLDHAITPLENQSTDVIRAFFAFLETNEFRYSERLRELFAIFFNTQKDFTQALSIASKAKHAHGDTWLTIKADSCEGLGQHKCATANHQQRWEQNKELDVGSRAVQYYLRQGNLQTADNLLTEMENLWEDHPEILALRSELNVQLESSGNKQVTLSINPGDTALRSLVSALYDNGQHEAALTALEVALSKFSPNDHTRIFAAQRFAWSGEYEKALSQLNQITVSTPESRLLQGQIYAWSGK
ncbi:MAG: tetratricopeptide repeat protein, partial [Pontibacterium sp.]